MSSQLMVHPLRLNLNQIPMYFHQMALDNDQDRLSRNHCHQHQYTSQRHFLQELKVISHRMVVQPKSNFLSKQLRGSLILIELKARDHLHHWRQLVHLEGLLRLLMLVVSAELAFHTD